MPPSPNAEQVTIAYENYADFKHDILQRVLEQTKARRARVRVRVRAERGPQSFNPYACPYR